MGILAAWHKLTGLVAKRVRTAVTVSSPQEYACAYKNYVIFSPMQGNRKFDRLDINTDTVTSFTDPGLDKAASAGPHLFFSGLTLSGDKMYALQHTANHDAIIDPLIPSITLVNGYRGGILGSCSGQATADNGFIYQAPWMENSQWTHFDPITNTATKFGPRHNAIQCMGAAKDHNGLIWAPPGNRYGQAAHNFIQICEPATNTVRDHPDQFNGYKGICYHFSEKLYAAPDQAQGILEIDPNTETVTKLAPTQTGLAYPVVGANGLIYFMPIRAGTKWIEFNPQTQAIRDIAPGDTTGEISSGTVAANKNIYCATTNGTMAKIIDAY